jgi:hypothetical protein
MKALSNSLPALRQVVTFLAAISLMCVTTRATTDPRSVNGIVSVIGTVEIDGQRTLSGQTMFGQAHVVTAVSSESVIAFSNRARLSVAAETEVKIDVAEKRIAGALQAGGVQVWLPAGITLVFSTPDLTITCDGSDEVSLTIRSAECEGSRISVSSGQVITKAGNRTASVNAGETLSTALLLTAGSPTPQAQSGKNKLGIFAAIGGAVAIILAAALGQNDQGQNNSGGPIDLAPNLSPR